MLLHGQNSDSAVDGTDELFQISPQKRLQHLCFFSFLWERVATVQTKMFMQMLTVFFSINTKN